jgi:hypothetical protein
MDLFPSSGERETPTLFGLLDLRETRTLLDSLDLKDPIEWVSPSHLRTETDPASETLCLLVSRIPDGGQSPKT